MGDSKGETFFLPIFIILLLGNVSRGILNYPFYNLLLIFGDKSWDTLVLILSSTSSNIPNLSIIDFLNVPSGLVEYQLDFLLSLLIFLTSDNYCSRTWLSRLNPVLFIYDKWHFFGEWSFELIFSFLSIALVQWVTKSIHDENE